MRAVVPVRHLIAGVLTLLACGTAAHAQDLHKDARLGFTVRPPRGWKEIPVRTDEGWIVGKYVATKPERTNDPTSGYTLAATPELVIVAILEPSVRKQMEAETKTADPEEPDAEGDDEDEDEDEEDVGGLYRDYPAYLKENCRYGHFIEKEETGKQGELTVTRYEIKAERTINVPEHRIITWVYETELAKIAVQFDVIADSFKKFQGPINDALRSFKVIPRTEPLTSGAPDGYLSLADMEKLTPAERKQKKMDLQRSEFERMKADLPADWTASEIDGVFVLNHVDERFARRVVEHIKAIYGWLDGALDTIGQHEYARTPLVRICKDYDEETAFRSGSGTYWVGGTHLVTHEGRRDNSREWEYIGSRTLGIWLLERDPKLLVSLPPWLQTGLSEVAASAKLQSGKLVFEMGNRERYVREDLPRGDEDSMSVRALMTLSNEEFTAFGKRDDWKTWCQAVALTRYFVGSRAKKPREQFEAYLNNLKLVLQELEAEDEKSGIDGKPPANEEEEEKLFEERTKRFKELERTVLDRTLERTFPGWSAGDWKGLDREFRRSL